MDSTSICQKFSKESAERKWNQPEHKNLFDLKQMDQWWQPKKYLRESKSLKNVEAFRFKKNCGTVSMAK